MADINLGRPLHPCVLVFILAAVFQVRRNFCLRRTTSRLLWWRSVPWWGSTRLLKATSLLTRTEWSRSPPLPKSWSKMPVAGWSFKMGRDYVENVGVLVVENIRVSTVCCFSHLITFFFVINLNLFSFKLCMRCLAMLRMKMYVNQFIIKKFITS